MPFPESPDGAAPAAAPAGLDFAQALRFAFDDPDWIKKILLGGLFSLLGVLIVGVLFVSGYVVRLIRRSAKGEARPLPDWDDLGGLFGDGIPVVGVYLAHVLPVTLVPLFVLFASALVFGGTIGLAERSEPVAGALGALLSLVMLGLYAVFMLAMLALMLYLPAALVRLALFGRFGAAFEWRENLGFIRRNAGQYLLAIGFYLIASFVAQFGVILCFFGVFPASFWSVCVLAFCLGQVARGDAELGRAAV
jgi:hypothetical protein